MNADTFLWQFSPELILLVGACVTLIAGAGKAALRSTSASGLACATVILALLVSIWHGQPSGESAVLGMWVTPLTFYVRCIALGVGLLIVLVNWHQPEASERGEYMALILFSLLGVLLTASANDLVVLFFAIELVSIPTYVLIALSRQDRRASEAAVKYFFLGALATAILAYGMSFLYGATGSTIIQTVSDGVVSSKFPSGPDMGGTALIGLLLVIVGLAFKVAAVPLHVYVPDVYEGAASPITGMLGFVPKLAGFVALVKIFSAFHWDLPVEINWLMWVLAALTMTVGNVLALLQDNVKRMLAYSSIAHTGYMLIALLVGPVAGRGPMHDGVAALLFYIAVYGAMNLGAFALLTAYRRGEQDVETLEDLAGLAKRAPLAALALAICVFSLMGFPPTAGFLGKLYIFASAFSVDMNHAFRGPVIALAIIGVINSAIAAGYYLRIVANVYMGQEPQKLDRCGGAPVRLGLALCSIPMLVLFAWPAGLAKGARDAAVVMHHTAGGSNVQVTSAADIHERDDLAETVPPILRSATISDP
ncbi:MAG: NADH-quinone oxidoreductase subunit N [Planctomycetes bacterium]|nr:NADH-quinone oxidoreductase subunit N [Planctomycetota bacterium]